MTADTEMPLSALSRAGLRVALIARADAITHQLGVDADNTQWLASMVAIHGWPDRPLVRADGALAALILAARAPLAYQATWRCKLENALRSGTVDTDLTSALLASIAARRGTAA